MMWFCLSRLWGPGLHMTEDGTCDWLPEAYSKAGCVASGGVCHLCFWGVRNRYDSLGGRA